MITQTHAEVNFCKQKFGILCQFKKQIKRKPLPTTTHTQTHTHTNDNSSQFVKRTHGGKVKKYRLNWKSFLPLPTNKTTRCNVFDRTG